MGSRDEVSLSVTPKTAFISKSLKGKVLLITSEDKEYWSKGENKPLPMDAIAEAPEVDTIVLGEVLQRVENPVEYLKLAKKKSKRIIITVPNEWSWAQQWHPFENKQHKQKYDADLLAEHLDAVGLTYVMKAIDYQGWAFLGAEATG